MADRLDNDAFYAASPAPSEPALEEAEFYRQVERPPARPSPLAELAARPVRFGLILFAIGWIGIAFQGGIFHQIVAGAPLFEEPAKVGGAIAIAGLLGFRAMMFRVPLAALFGAGFGVMEHYVGYAEEDLLGYGVRVAFHAISAATSMVAFAALEPDPDARLRWVATVPATLLHYANNFVALVLGLSSLVLPWLDTLAMGWSIGVTAALLLTMAWIAARPEAFRLGVAALVARFRRGPPAA